MAVVGCIANGKPHTFTCWYCVYDGNLYWKSRTESIHSQAFAKNADASLCIYDHAVSYPDNKTGVQVTGTVYKVTDRGELQGVLDVLAVRFGKEVYQKNNIDELADQNTKSTFYAFKPSQLKLVAKHLGVHMEHFGDFNL